MPAAGPQKNASRAHRAFVAPRGDRLTATPRARASLSDSVVHAPSVRQADTAEQTREFRAYARRPAQISIPYVFIPHAISMYLAGLDDLAPRDGRAA